MANYMLMLIQYFLQILIEHDCHCKNYEKAEIDLSNKKLLSVAEGSLKTLVLNLEIYLSHE